MDYKYTDIKLKSKGSKVSNKSLYEGVTCKKYKGDYFLEGFNYTDYMYIFDFSMCIPIDDSEEIFTFFPEENIYRVYSKTIGDREINAAVIVLGEYLKPQEYVIELMNIEKKHWIRKILNEGVSNKIKYRILIVKYRSQLFEVMSYLFAEKYSENFIKKSFSTKIYDVLVKLEKHTYSEDEIISLGLSEFLLEDGLIPILEKVSDKDWIFYKDNFDKYEEEIKEKFPS